MNKEDFELYLKSIGGLERTWRNERGPVIDAGFFELHEGWYELLKNLIGELIVAGWDKKVVQVKEKFGGLRFYIPSSDVVGDEVVEIKIPQLIRNIIRKYEELSYHTCEKCGKDGVLRKGKWIRTLCDEHSEGNPPMEKQGSKTTSPY